LVGWLAGWYRIAKFYGRSGFFLIFSLCFMDNFFSLFLRFGFAAIAIAIVVVVVVIVRVRRNFCNARPG